VVEIDLGGYVLREGDEVAAEPVGSEGLEFTPMTV
jgi:hypothetical protein